MLSSAFNRMLSLHSRPVTLLRLGSPDRSETGFRVTPSSYFRQTEAPSQMIVEGREFVISKNALGALSPPWVLKIGDRLVDPDMGTLTIKSIQEMNDFGGSIMGYRVRTN